MYLERPVLPHADGVNVPSVLVTTAKPRGGVVILHSYGGCCQASGATGSMRLSRRSSSRSWPRYPGGSLMAGPDHLWRQGCP
jgi:hypothetical protein